METLNYIFGGRERVRMMRLFLLNPDKIYETKSITLASRGSERHVARELVAFEKVGLVKRRRYFAEGKRGRLSLVGWGLNHSFIYLNQLRSLLLNDALMENQDVVRRLGKGGSLKLIVLAGVFIQNWESRVDLLIVGDKLKKGKLERMLRSMESEIGRELRYSILDSGDFQYRLSIGDRLIRDIFDFPHQIVLDKLKIEV